MTHPHTQSLPFAPLFSIERSDRTEKTVYGALGVWTGDDRPVMTAGDATFAFWGRSLLKPFQLLSLMPVIKGKFDWLRQDQMAMLMASHDGEPGHITVLEDLIARFNLSDSVLHCPECYPMNTERSVELRRRGMHASPVYHPCSGKHLGMILAHIAQSKALTDYLHPECPEYTHQHALLNWLCGSVSPHTTRDGCGMPNWCLTTTQLAKAYALLAAPLVPAQKSTAPETLQHALAYWDELRETMVFQPEMIGGSHRLDTRLMQGKLSRQKNVVLVAKEGADGLLAIGIEPTLDYPSGVGVCIKLSHGYNSDDLETLATEILRLLGFGKLQVLSGDAILNTRFHFELRHPTHNAAH